MINELYKYHCLYHPATKSGLSNNTTKMNVIHISKNWPSPSFFLLIEKVHRSDCFSTILNNLLGLKSSFLNTIKYFWLIIPRNEHMIILSKELSWKGPR